MTRMMTIAAVVVAMHQYGDGGGGDETDGMNDNAAFDTNEVTLHPNITIARKKAVPVTRA